MDLGQVAPGDSVKDAPPIDKGFPRGTVGWEWTQSTPFCNGYEFFGLASCWSNLCVSSRASCFMRRSDTSCSSKRTLSLSVSICRAFVDLPEILSAKDLINGKKIITGSQNTTPATKMITQIAATSPRSIFFIPL
jgi:hypothetical protein